MKKPPGVPTPNGLHRYLKMIPTTRKILYHLQGQLASSYSEFPNNSLAVIFILIFKEIGYHED